MKIFIIIVVLTFFAAFIGTIVHFLLFRAPKNQSSTSSSNTVPTQTKTVENDSIGDKNRAIENYHIALFYLNI